MKNDSPKHFWEWFEKFSNVYLWLHTFKDKDDFMFWIGEINNHLRTYCRGGITAIFEWDAGGEAAQLIITAKSKSNLFFKVDQLIKHAPQLPGWQFHALVPPRLPGHKIMDSFNDIGIDPDELRFCLSNAHCPGPRINIEVFTEVYNPGISRYRQLIEAVVFNILGERAMATYIGEVEIKWLYTLSIQHRAKLLKLEKLPALLIPQKATENITGHNLSMTSLKRAV